MQSNAEALESAITALQGLGDEHAAIIAHARTLAREIDLEPSEAKLHGEYRQVLKMLYEAGATREVDAFERLLTQLRGDD
jgi:hypothetical protein